MEPTGSGHRRNLSTPEGIPLQSIGAQQGDFEPNRNGGAAHRRTLSDRGRSLFRHNRQSTLNTAPPSRLYTAIEDEEGPPSPPVQRPSLSITTPAGVSQHVHRDEYAPMSPVSSGLQDAIGFAGISLDGPTTPEYGGRPPPRALRVPTLRLNTNDSTPSLANDDDDDDDDVTGYFPSENDGDTVPLTGSGSRLDVPKPGGPSTPTGQRHDRSRGSSFNSVQFLSPTSGRLGDGWHDAEAGHLEGGSNRSRSNSNRSLSPTSMESPLRRAGTTLRKMSQRIVNLSNEAELVERDIRRKSSIRHIELPSLYETSGPDSTNDGAASIRSPVSEKSPSSVNEAELPPRPDTNPFRGKSLGIFSPDNKFRLALCSLLVHPFTEPIVLALIVTQTVLLAVEASRNVFVIPDPAMQWGHEGSDWAVLAIFSLYTIEIFIRCIVSGFVFNPVEYSTIDRKIGFFQAIRNQANLLLAVHRKPPSQRPTSAVFGPQQSSLVRAFTGQAFSETPVESQDARQSQRRRLAHRAFLRHSFNRLDFVAVVSFWINFLISILGVQQQHHIYVFKMLSCLRIVRLLGITSGTSVILRSLKRAAPILLNVAFLIGFFWLLFAIIGVQSFKSSLRRTCVWFDNTTTNSQSPYAANSTGNFQFCGGYLSADLVPMPYLLEDGMPDSTSKAKGYLCPVNSQCIESTNPYNGTVSFDNLLQSLELVFVVMTSNTFSDLLYYLTDSDYLAAALFFAFGIMIMTLWLVNLLIAVITSSFQVIREESKASAFAAEEKDGPEPETPQPSVHKPRKSAMQCWYDKTYWVWIAVIAYSLLVQCSRTDSMSSFRDDFILASELVVTIVLDVEIAIRFVVGWRHFFKSKRNVVDVTLAVITTIIQIPRIRNSGQAYAWLTLFQILRVYRLVLAVRIMRELIGIVLGNFYGILNLILFVFLVTFLAAIFASQLFRGQLQEEDMYGNTIQVPFFTLWNSFLGMYQILSSENWTTILYSVTSFNVSNNNGWIGATFCILWFTFGNFIVLNMFIAVIQENFDVSEDEKRLQQVKAFLQQKRFGTSTQGTLSLAQIFKFGQVRRQDPLDFGSAATEMLLKEAVVRDFLDEPEVRPDGNTPDSTAATPAVGGPEIQPGVKGLWWTKFVERFTNREPNPFYASLQLSSAYQDLDARGMAVEVVQATDRRKIAQREYLKKYPGYNVSLFVFKPQNPIRKFCQKIVGPGRGGTRIQGSAPSAPVWYIFSAFTYTAIVAMVLLACITTPLYQKEYFAVHGFNRTNWFVWTDIGFAVLFTIEAAIKGVADGFIWTPNAYFRGSWGFIDGIVLVTLWANVIALLVDPGGGSRAIGAFKALRALRLLNISDSARDTFHSVIVMGGWKVISAAFVSLSLLLPFAIYGLNLFNGKMQGCNDLNSGIYNLTDCVGEYMSTPYNWDVLAPRQVANSYFSFDNFGASLFILFQIVSQEGWIDVMWRAQAITGVFTQPSYFSSQGNAVFFVIFNLLGAVFVLTLFVSVFMRNYTEQTGVAFLTTDQRSWLELRKLLQQISPSKRPSSKKVRKNWKEWCYKRAIRKNGRWQRAVTAALVLHLVLLCLEWYPDSSDWLRIRDFLFLALTCFYIANITVRIIGLSWTRFRRSAWDAYSLLSVSGTLVSTLLLLSDFHDRDYVQLHKLFLVSITLLLIPRNNQLDQLFKTAAASLTAIGNLLATWFVLFLVFAIAFTQTFGLTRFNENETGNINFRSVPKALILLFRFSVGEGWNQIMYDFATVVPPYCTVGGTYFEGDCGGESWARALFVAWNILSMYIFVNLFVSLIYESFSYVYQRTSGLSVISREEIRRFKQAWAEFDPSGSGYISKTDFPRLLGELSGVFEMRIYDGDWTIRSILEDCQVQPKRSSTMSSMPFDGTSYRGSGLPYGGNGEGSSKVEVDVVRLNERLADLPVLDIRRRRARMNTFYEEVLVSADPDRGVEFNALLMILAHYKVINDSKSLRLEEFLRRRARLQRVDEAVRRNIVVGFFDTLYWSRRFRRAIDAKKNLSRMTTIPQLDVPEIFVQDESENVSHVPPKNLAPTTPIDRLSFDWPDPRSGGRSTAVISGSDAGSSPGGSVQRRARSDSIPYSSQESPTRGGNARAFLFGRQHSPANSTGSARDDWLHEPPSPGLLPVGDAGSDGAGDGRSRAGSAVSAQDVLEVLDNSAWGESIRRSFTTRRPSEGSAGHRRLS